MPSRDELLSYLERIARDADLLAAPPTSIAGQPESWADVAIDDVDRGLERWAWGITAWGREAATTAALGILEEVMPLWDSAATAQATGTEAIVENAERGFGPSPRTLYERLVAWHHMPSVAEARSLHEHDQGDHLDLFDVIGNEEFKACWSDTWMFALTAVYAAALLPGADASALPRLLGIVAISGRRALGAERDAASRTFQWMAAKLREA